EAKRNNNGGATARHVAPPCPFGTDADSPAPTVPENDNADVREDVEQDQQQQQQQQQSEEPLSPSATDQNMSSSFKKL
ncbi:hypothetical protein CRUP_014706, partial [Coryphaenoides rupestris]